MLRRPSVCLAVRQRDVQVCFTHRFEKSFQKQFSRLIGLRFLLGLTPQVGDLVQCVFVLMAPPLFHPNFGGVPVGPDRRCWSQSEQIPSAIRP